MSLFDRIRGQERAVSILVRALEKGRVPAAYLFTGPPGTGRMDAALALAASLNCETGQLACGTCPSCRLHGTGHHPDLAIVRPEEGKREIVIRQVREGILGRAYLMPLQGRASTFVVDDAHLMNPSSANAFLKTLEEPPATSRFVLIVPGRESVLPTIASRCQAVTFQPLSREIVADLLVERGLDPDRARMIAAMARGSMERALSYHDAGLIDDLLSEFEPLAALPDTGLGELLDLSQRWARNREEALGVLEVMAQWYRDLLVLAEGGDPRSVIHLARLDTLNRTAGRIGGRAIAASLESVESAAEALRANANVQLTIDTLLLDISEAHGPRRPA